MKFVCAAGYFVWFGNLLRSLHDPSTKPSECVHQGHGTVVEHVPMRVSFILCFERVCCPAEIL